MWVGPPLSLSVLLWLSLTKTNNGQKHVKIKAEDNLIARYLFQEYCIII